MVDLLILALAIAVGVLVGVGYGVLIERRRWNDLIWRERMEQALSGKRYALSPEAKTPEEIANAITAISEIAKEQK